MKNQNKENDYTRQIMQKLMPLLHTEDLKTIARNMSQEALRRELEESNTHILESKAICPVDNTHSVIKYGKSSGTQRYFCKDCNKAFSFTGKSMLGHTHLDLVTWRSLIRDTIKNKASLTNMADTGDISRVTAFYCRLRIFYAIECLNQAIRLTNVIEADETFVTYNAKGQSFEKIDRNPRKRGNCNTRKNWPQNSIAIVVAVQRKSPDSPSYKICSCISGFGNSSSQRIYEALKDRIEPSERTLLLTDGTHTYNLLVKRLNIRHTRLTAKEKGNKKIPTCIDQYHIQTVNSFHNCIVDYISSLRGVSTKYLKGYLQVFDFNQNYSDLSVEEKEMLILNQLTNSSTHLTNKELTRRYVMMYYIDQYAKDWKKHFSKEECAIYAAVKKGKQKKHLVEKYNYSYKRIRSLVKKIDDLKIEGEILKQAERESRGFSREISPKSWEIYTLYQTGKYTQMELAEKFGCTFQNISKIVAYINRRPEAYARTKKLTQTELQKRRKSKNPDVFKEKKQRIYNQFNVLCKGNKDMTLKQAYILLGKTNNLSEYTVRNIVFEQRQKDKNAVWRKKGNKIAIDFKHHQP